MFIAQGTSTLISQENTDLKRFSLWVILDKDTPRCQLIESRIRFTGLLEERLGNCWEWISWSFLDNSVDYAVDCAIDLYSNWLEKIWKRRYLLNARASTPWFSVEYRLRYLFAWFVIGIYLENCSPCFWFPTQVTFIGFLNHRHQEYCPCVQVHLQTEASPCHRQFRPSYNQLGVK